jgi:hypothetical protein
MPYADPGSDRRWLLLDAAKEQLQFGYRKGADLASARTVDRSVPQLDKKLSV